MCFLNPFREEMLKNGLNSSTYTSFLLGNHWNESMLNVNYDQVTYNLQEFVVHPRAYYNSQSEQRYNIEIKSIKEFTVPIFLGIYKCITIDMPNPSEEKMMYASLTVKNSIFSNGIRPTGDRFWVLFHYPTQFLRNVIATKWIWPKRNYASSNTSYLDMFVLQSMEVLHRRNKVQDPCEYHHHFDKDLIETIMLDVGCVPPYWHSNRNLTRCKSKEQMKRFHTFGSNTLNGNAQALKYTLQPCVDLQKLTFDFEEQEADIRHLRMYGPQNGLLNNESYTIIFIAYLESKFKEIKQTKAFGIESLVGNVGGYIALFLGVSVIQLPSFLMKLYRKLQKRNNTNQQTESKFEIEEGNPTKDVNTEEQLNDISALSAKVYTMEEKLSRDDISALSDRVLSLEEKLVRVTSSSYKWSETRC
jgi:hypothetical protein